MPADFRRHVVGKLGEMFVTVISFNYALLVSTYRHFLKPTDSFLFEWHTKSSPINSASYNELYPQNGDRIVNMDYVTSLHPLY